MHLTFQLIYHAPAKTHLRTRVAIGKYVKLLNQFEWWFCAYVEGKLINVARYDDTWIHKRHMWISTNSRRMGRNKINNCTWNYSIICGLNPTVSLFARTACSTWLISFKLIGASKTTHRLLILCRSHDNSRFMSMPWLDIENCEADFFQLKTVGIKVIAWSRCRNFQLTFNQL